jgi:hypothetical protein
VALDSGEPVLYLIEPVGVGRGEVQMNVGMLGKELLNLSFFLLLATSRTRFSALCSALDALVQVRNPRLETRRILVPR